METDNFTISPYLVSPYFSPALCDVHACLEVHFQLSPQSRSIQMSGSSEKLLTPSLMWSDPGHGKGNYPSLHRHSREWMCTLAWSGRKVKGRDSMSKKKPTKALLPASVCMHVCVIEFTLNTSLLPHPTCKQGRGRRNCKRAGMETARGRRKVTSCRDLWLYILWYHVITLKFKF